MLSPDIHKPLIILLGPTAAGKTDISLILAQKLDGEIVSADSRLFYRGMDIGTAKPGPSEMKNIPHHLVDIVNPDQTWSLSVFQRQANAAINAIHRRGRIPILVGGTGQYIRALIEGWEAPPIHSDPAIREIITRWGEMLGARRLHQALMKLDPAAAQIIEPNNLRRTVRGFEVIFLTGQRFSEQRKKNPPGYSVMMVGIHRSRLELFERIDQRIDAMFACGLIDEVRNLLDSGYSADLPAFSAIGYRQAAAVVRGEMTIEEAKTEMKKITRQFIRRQANWFKENDPRIHWIAADSICVAKIISLSEDPASWILTG